MRARKLTSAQVVAADECPVCAHPRGRHRNVGCDHCQCGLTQAFTVPPHAEPETAAALASVTFLPVPEVTDFCRSNLLEAAAAADELIRRSVAGEGMDYREVGRVLGRFVANVQGLADNEGWRS